MWCLPCCGRPSTSEDHFEAETRQVIEVSLYEAQIKEVELLSLATHEAEQLDLAIQESSRLPQQKEDEERRRKRELEKDAQIVKGLEFFGYDEREREINIKTALGDQEDEQLQKTVLESLKENIKRKQCEEQVEKDEQLALVVQESVNMAKFPTQIEEAELRSLATHEAEQLDLAIQESSRLRQQKEDEERRRKRELEKDAQIAKGLEYEERGREINNQTALGDQEDELLQKSVLESLKENNERKQYEEQVEKDEQLALVVQESLNMAQFPTQIEENKSVSRRAPSDVDKQLTKAVKASLKDKGKRKQFEDDQVENDKQYSLMVQESLNMGNSPPRYEKNNNILAGSPMADNEQWVIWESLKGTGQRKQSNDKVEDDGKLPKVNPPSSMYGGSNSVIEDERSVNVSGVLCHPDCLTCDTCDKPINKDHVSNSRGNFHKSCYERYCYICEGKVREYGLHPYWKVKYCRAHDTDGTPMCCSCERLEPKGMDYVMFDDGRRLCLECMDSAVMDSHECQPLHFEMREFFEGLNLKIEEEFPFLLVEKQALNKAEKEEKRDNEFEGLTRGICLSEEQIVDSVSKRPTTKGSDNKLTGKAIEPQRVVRTRKCEVTAILIVYGLPRLLTGYILAHEMMHAYFRLKGLGNLNQLLEEGICQLLGHMWLETQTYGTVDETAAAASSSASSSSSSSCIQPSASTSKKGKCSDFEKELVGFFKNQIETDDTPLYGEGFREVHKIWKKNLESLEATIREIIGRSGSRLS